MSTSDFCDQLSSREYKLMLQPLMFGSKSAVDYFAKELVATAKRFDATIDSKAGFGESATRTIEFLDTREQVLRRINFLLRVRGGEGKSDESELTLKCRAADPFIALNTKLTIPEGKKVKAKLEEDICPPFISRLSRSITVPVKKRLPQTIDDCGEVFPGLASNLPKMDDTPLVRVRDMRIFEQVLSGLVFELAGQAVETALIIWRHSPKGRLAVVEFSFRYKVGDSEISRSVALRFMQLFDAVCSMDWASSSSITKTNYLYGTNPEHA